MLAHHLQSLSTCQHVGKLQIYRPRALQDPASPSHSVIAERKELLFARPLVHAQHHSVEKARMHTLNGQVVAVRVIEEALDPLL